MKKETKSTKELLADAVKSVEKLNDQIIKLDVNLKQFAKKYGIKNKDVLRTIENLK